MQQRVDLIISGASSDHHERATDEESIIEGPFGSKEDNKVMNGAEIIAIGVPCSGMRHIK